MTTQVTRRHFIKNAALLSGAAASFPFLPSQAADPNPPAASSAPNLLTLDASARPPAASTNGFHMGTATAPDGHTLTLDSRSLLRDGQPWLLISGEFHYARCPDAEWRDELLKIKAGGVSLVATYIFWIHHEEVEGAWDWTGQRDLRKFLETSRDVGLNVLLRVGPWCHGEVRHGGFPDWLQKLGDDKVIELRRDNPGYLAYVTQLYGQISQQTQGLLWKDGGPVIAIQVENEYSGPAGHLLTLKHMAQAAGLDVPLYTCTGWGGHGQTAFGELVPFSGSYVDGFWDRSLKAGGYGGVLRFSGFRQRGNAAAMGALGAAPATANPPPPSAGVYPSFTCELGGGMMASYHRRVFLYPEDAESLALVKLGSGVNLLGFYMYHGGLNPVGKRTWLNETQATGYWNDLPVKNYDFQAPIGAFGQEREHYHFLRLLGLYLQDFGPGLAGLTSHNPSGRDPVNWAVRSDGETAWLYVSQYEHLGHQAAVENIQFRVHLADGDVTMPSGPVTIPYNTRFFWPINLDLGGVKLVSATAQPITRVNDGAVRHSVFKQTAGIPVEFVFDAGTTVESTTGELLIQAASLATETTAGSSPGAITSHASPIHIRNVPAGPGAAIRLKGSDGSQHVIIVLVEDTAFDLWKGPWQGQDRLFLTSANVLLDGSTLRLHAENPTDFPLGIFPAPTSLNDGHAEVPASNDGLFRRFSPVVTPPATVPIVVEPVQPAGPARTIPIAPGSSGMAMQPEDADFAQAAVWQVKFPEGIDPARDLRLRIHYTGDVLRAYQGDQLLADDFYHARPFEIGLRRFSPTVYQDGLLLKILPLREDAPVYITDRSALKFDDQTHTALSLGTIEVIETTEVRLEST
jgi:beta-galactosidase